MLVRDDPSRPREINYLRRLRLAQCTQLGDAGFQCINAKFSEVPCPRTYPTWQNVRNRALQSVPTSYAYP